MTPFQYNTTMAKGINHTLVGHDVEDPRLAIYQSGNTVLLAECYPDLAAELFDPAFEFLKEQGVKSVFITLSNEEQEDNIDYLLSEEAKKKWGVTCLAQKENPNTGNIIYFFVAELKP